jgi:hypothetical protein
MWLEVARPAIEDRMARYSASETSFALLSLNPKRSQVLETTIGSLEERLAFLGEVCASQSGFGSMMNDGFAVGGSVEEVQRQIEEVSAHAIVNTPQHHSATRFVFWPLMRAHTYVYINIHVII